MITHINPKNINKIKRNKRKLEEKLNIKIKVSKDQIEIESNPLNEYKASLVFEAINSGFSTETALDTLDDETTFEKINIKDHTKRKNLSLIRSRIIGKHGKTKKTIEEISNCKIEISENTVSLIGQSESVNDAIRALISIIKGSKQTNMYKYLEKINTKKRSQNKI
tara:strand:- start:2017 stop:2514 length:498 start_codon:yes stop_codon:yes gene_type:complete